MQFDDKRVKDYFSREGTVSQWWRPESDRAPLLRSLYIDQRFILRQLFNPVGKTILDVGTGGGRFAIDFALAGAEQVSAVDVSGEMLRIAKKRATQVGVANKILFQKGDAENLGFEDDTFDVTICMETFIHLPNPQAAMKELARVTKPLGLVIANTTVPGRMWKILTCWVDRKWSFRGILRSFFYQHIGQECLLQ